MLGRVSPQQFKKVSLPPGDSGTPFVNADPLSSNIYSVGERILLAWLNHHYKEQKQKTWGTNRKGKFLLRFSYCFTIILTISFNSRCAIRRDIMK